MERLTIPNGDYCELVCGLKNTCKRLDHPCKDSLFYAKLRDYEDTGIEPENFKEAYQYENS